MFNPKITNAEPLSNLLAVNGAYTNINCGYGEIIIGEGCQFATSVKLGDTATDNLPALKEGVELVSSTASATTVSYAYTLAGVEYSSEVTFIPAYEAKKTLSE
jgi:hypothetical protein